MTADDKRLADGRRAGKRASVEEPRPGAAGCKSQTQVCHRDTPALSWARADEIKVDHEGQALVMAFGRVFSAGMAVGCSEKPEGDGGLPAVTVTGMRRRRMTGLSFPRPLRASVGVHQKIFQKFFSCIKTVDGMNTAVSGKFRLLFHIIDVDSHARTRSPPLLRIAPAEEVADLAEQPSLSGHGSLNHARQHIAHAGTIVSRGERWGLGAALVNAYRRMVKDREDACKGKYRGFAALNRGGLTRRLWVVEEPGASGLRRGAEVKRVALKQKLEGDCGAAFREVVVPASTALERGLSTMAKAVKHVRHPVQFSCEPQRLCTDSSLRHVDAKVLMVVDLRSALDCVPLNEVTDIFCEVFLVKRGVARQMADLCTARSEGAVGRRLYSGNPLCLALFNIRTLWCVERLNRLCEANGLVMTVYAGDLCISSSRWTHFSKGFRKTVSRIFRECGLCVGPQDLSVRAVDARKLGRCDITGVAVGFEAVTGTPFTRPLYRRRVLSGDARSAYLRSRDADGWETGPT